MSTRPLYSGLDLRGLPLRGVGSPVADDDVVSKGHLELRVAALVSRIEALEQRIATLEARSASDPLVVSPTDPGITKGLWIQTGLGQDGSGVTFWYRDGTV